MGKASAFRCGGERVNSSLCMDLYASAEPSSFNEPKGEKKEEEKGGLVSFFLGKSKNMPRSKTRERGRVGVG